MRAAFSRVARDRRRIEIERDDRAEAESVGGDREDAGAAARVEQAPALPRREQLDAQPRGRVRARPERATGVDDDSGHASRHGLPGRADPEPADEHRAMELTPALLPTRLDGSHGRIRERQQQTRCVIARGVHGELDLVVELDLLEPSGRELQIAALVRSPRRHGPPAPRRDAARLPERALQTPEEPLVVVAGGIGLVVGRAIELLE